MSEETKPPFRRLVLALVDGTTGAKQQVALNESSTDSSDETITELVRALRESAPRLDNVVPFETP